MEIRERVQRLLYAAIDEVNLGLPAGERLDKGPHVVIVGGDGRLDSLGLINFVVAAEQRLREEFQAPLSLTEMVTSQDQGQYRTLGALCDAVTRMVEARVRGD